VALIGGFNNNELSLATRSSVALALREVLKERNKYKWTEEDVKSIRETLKGSKLVFLRALT
jgi:hypothetical protein